MEIIKLFLNASALVCTHLFIEPHMWFDRFTYVSRPSHIIWNDRLILYETIEIWGGLQKYIFTFTEFQSILRQNGLVKQ